MRDTGYRVRDAASQSIEQPNEQHAVHRSAHGSRSNVDVAFCLLADAVTKHSPEIVRQRFTPLIQEEQQQNRERDDEHVSGHELPQRLRPGKKCRRVSALRPPRQGSGYANSFCQRAFR